jgi:cell shape-determining protein MreC
MGQFRSKNLFFGLMTIAFVVTFMLPARMSGRFRPQLGILFAPVSRPAAGVARMITGHTLVATSANDHRTDDNLRLENEALRAEVARLTSQLNESARRDSELANLGNMRNLCVVALVAGADTGGRESITLVGRSLLNVRAGMYALTREGLVGRIDSVSSASAQVRLITDPGVRLRCRFWTFENDSRQPAPLSQVVVEGRGDGVMTVRHLKLSDLRLDNSLQPIDTKLGPALHVGDYCLLDDGDCPHPLQFIPLGRVERIDPSPGGRLMADVMIRPVIGLKTLSEVMVMNKEQ